MTVASAINHHRWFGHYCPGRPAPIGVNKDAFIAATQTPLHTPADISRLFDAAGALLPTFQPIATALHRGDFAAMLSDGDQVAYVERRDGQRTVFLPSNQPIVRQLATFFHIMATLMPLPEGVELPAMPTIVGAREQYITAQWSRYYWQMAINHSFLCQMTYELERAGVSMFRPGTQWQLLHATDLTLFLLLRETGLAGVASAYSTFMRPQMQQRLEEIFATLASRCQIGLASVVDWSPPEVDARPWLAHTSLDNEAEKLLPHSKALYRQAQGIGRLPPATVARIRAQLARPVRTVADLRNLLALLPSIAPALARDLAPVIQECRVGGRIVLTMVAASSIPQPVVPAMDITGIFGRSEGPQQLLAGIGCPGRQILPALVGTLAKILPPAALHEEVILNPEGARNVDILAGYIEDAIARNEMWGHSAVFEFVHETRQLGLEFVLDDLQQAMERVLRECGYWVLCEWWDDFNNPHTRTARQRQYRQMAEEYIHAVG